MFRIFFFFFFFLQIIIFKINLTEQQFIFNESPQVCLRPLDLTASKGK